MTRQILIDNIVRQTTILIAQLATSGGVRSPLAQVADRAFLEWPESWTNRALVEESAPTCSACTAALLLGGRAARRAGLRGTRLGCAEGFCQGWPPATTAFAPQHWPRAGVARWP
jgi:hypothetical protein